MNVFLYDGSFEGLLSCVFESYRTQIIPDKIENKERHQPILLGQTIEIVTDVAQAERVLKGLDKRTQGRAHSLFYKLFLSEDAQMEVLLHRIARLIIESGSDEVLENYANPFVLKVSQIIKMMNREIHRMHAFVRFQKTNDNLYYATIAPDFDVLPLIGEHFQKRYADQSWIIFDTKRKYGIFYDQKDEIAVITIEDRISKSDMGQTTDAKEDEKEKIYQTLWESYFHSVNIKERKNIKLHLRHVPKRYWKYLTEKKQQTNN